MNTMKTIKTAALAIAISAALASPSVMATGMVAGATEPTQIMNNIELMTAQVERLEQGIKRVQHFTKQIEHYQKTLEKLAPEKVRGLLKGFKDARDLAQNLKRQYNSAKEMAHRMDNLTDNLKTLSKEGKIAANVMESLRKSGRNISGNDYIGAMKELSEVRSEEYGERIKKVREASEAAQDDIERINKINELNPEISSNVEGLQAIVGTNNVIAGQLAYMNQTQTELTVEQMKLNRELIREVDEEQIRQKQNEDVIKHLFSPIGK